MFNVVFKALFAAALCSLFGWVHAEQGFELSVTLRGAQQDLDVYGDHVAFNDQWLMIGAPREDIDVEDASGPYPPETPEAEKDGILEDDIGAVYIYRRTPDGPVFHQKLVGSSNSGDSEDGQIGARFGAGIALDGEHLIIGAANDRNFPGQDPREGWGYPPFFFAGKAYYFHYETGADLWIKIQELTSPVPASFRAFSGRTESGHVALFGDIAVIGEPDNTPEDCGGWDSALYVFQRDNTALENPWQLIQTIFPPTGLESRFADKVLNLGSGHLLVSEDVEVNDVNCEVVAREDLVHVYQRGSTGLLNPVPVQTFASIGETDLGCFFGFGSAGIAARDSTVVVADPCDSMNPLGATEAGALYVYDYDATNAEPLSFVQQLFHPAPADFQNLGLNLGSGQQSVDTNGDQIVVGTSKPIWLSSLDVLVFKRDGATGWDPIPELIANPEPPNDPFTALFGQSVALFENGDLTIADNIYGEGGGRLHIYAGLPTSQKLIMALADSVTSLNLHLGIENSLDAKLESALAALHDVQTGNDQAAVNKLQAFINAVEAQRGSKITNENADLLVNGAQEIIDLLDS